MRLIAFGDIHMDLGKIARIPDIASADLVLLTGDLTNFGGRRDARAIISRIQAVNGNILALAGNLDRPEVDDFLSELSLNLHGLGKTVNNTGIFGLGGSNPTPFHTPYELSEAELAVALRAGYGAVKRARQHILVSHPPPRNTKTDRINSGAHVGSTAVRAFIETAQPALCICGHIHEAKATDSIGATRIINPGMLKKGGWVEVLVDENSGVRATLQAV